MIFFGEEKDWKEYLTDEDKQILESVLSAIKRHKCAYEQADDVKVSQLWTAIIEMKKEINGMKELLGKMEEPFKAIISVGEAEKRKSIEKIVSEIMKPTDEETQEATKKLVESLMKF